jgi:Protein of unknown function (DUF4199)
MDNGLKYGLFGGLTLVLYQLGVYFVDKQLMLKGWLIYWLPLLLIHAPLMYKALLDDNRSQGKRDFRQASRTPFLVFVVGNVFFWLCNYGLHLFDHDLTRLELGLQLQHAQAQLKQGLGDPQEMNALRQSIQGLQTEIESVKVPLGPFIVQMGVWKILGFGVAAAITALGRK